MSNAHLFTEDLEPRPIRTTNNFVGIDKDDITMHQKGGNPDFVTTNSLCQQQYPTDLHLATNHGVNGALFLNNTVFNPAYSNYGLLPTGASPTLPLLSISAKPLGLSHSSLLLPETIPSVLSESSHLNSGTAVEDMNELTCAKTMGSRDRKRPSSPTSSLGSASEQQQQLPAAALTKNPNDSQHAAVEEVVSAASVPAADRKKNATKSSDAAAATVVIDERERKRQRKNLREQGRSQEIATLIGELQRFLEGEGVQFLRPTKTAVLFETVKFIRGYEADRARKEDKMNRGADGTPQLGTTVLCERCGSCVNGVTSLNDSQQHGQSACNVISPTIECSDIACSNTATTSIVGNLNNRQVMEAAKAVVLANGCFESVNIEFCRVFGAAVENFRELTLFAFISRPSVVKAFNMLRSMQPDNSKKSKRMNNTNALIYSVESIIPRLCLCIRLLSDDEIRQQQLQQQHPPVSGLETNKRFVVRLNWGGTGGEAEDGLRVNESISCLVTSVDPATEDKSLP